MKAEREVILKAVSAKCQKCQKRSEEVVDAFGTFTKKCSCDKILYFDVKISRSESKAGYDII